MLRRSILLGAAVVALACNNGPKKTGPVVAEGKGVKITADDFKKRIEEQSPFLRARYSTLERKKEFLQNLVQFEVLAQAAEKEGLANDPDVQLTLKKVMVQKLVSKKFGDPMTAAKEISDEEAQKYFDEHKDEYFRPKRVRVAVVAFEAPEGSPQRAAKVAAAKKALATVKAQTAKNPAAFAQVASTQSDDVATKASGGDLGFKTAADLEGAYGKAFSDAVFAIPDGQLSNVIETPKGAYVAKVTGHQDEVNRTFDQVKLQIQNKLAREKKTKEFEAWKKSLVDGAGVKTNDAELEKIEVAAGPAGMGGMGGMSGPHGMGGGMMGGPRVMPNAPPPAQGAPVQATPAPAPAK